MKASHSYYFEVRCRADSTMPATHVHKVELNVTVTFIPGVAGATFPFVTRSYQWEGFWGIQIATSELIGRDGFHTGTPRDRASSLFSTGCKHHRVVCYNGHCAYLSFVLTGLLVRVSKLNRSRHCPFSTGLYPLWGTFFVEIATD